MVCHIGNINSWQGAYFAFVYIQTKNDLLFPVLYSLAGINIQVHKAVDACKNVLRGLHSNKISQRELDRVNFFSLLFPSKIEILFSSLKWRPLL